MGGCLKTREIGFLIVLEAVDLISRWPQGRVPSEGSKETSSYFFHLLAVVVFGVPWLVVTLFQSLSHCHMVLCLCVHVPHFRGHQSLDLDPS